MTLDNIIQIAWPIAFAILALIAVCVSSAFISYEPAKVPRKNDDQTVQHVAAQFAQSVLAVVRTERQHVVRAAALRELQIRKNPALDKAYGDMIHADAEHLQTTASYSTDPTGSTVQSDETEQLTVRAG